MSTLSVNTIKALGNSVPVFQNSSGVEKGQIIKSWITFVGEGTVSIRQSFNVSSITDNGTGDYTITYATAFSNTTYCLVGSATEDEDGGAGNRGQFILSPTRAAHAAGSSRVHTMNCTNGNLFNCGRIEVHVIGDN
tara:strand:- start:641 stop:1048 length:408 start_codon:yes stop_codon:yes gene_type:complete